MALLGRLLRALSRPKPPAALEPVLRVRRLYLEQVQSTQNLQAAFDSLEESIRQHQKTAGRWRDRSRLPISEEMKTEAMAIAKRYGAYIHSAVPVRRECIRTLRTCRETQEAQLRRLTELGAAAARLGLDTRSLAVEIDMDRVERTAAERNALALIENGIHETDEEVAFMEKLFERGLEERVAARAATQLQ